MSSETPPMSSLSEIAESSPLDPIAEFERLKKETAEITAKIKASGPLLIPDANTSNEILGILLSELKMMRKEVKEIKESVFYQKETLGKIESAQETQKEALNSINKNLEEIGEKQTKHQGVVNGMKENLKEIKEKQMSLQRNVNTLNCQPAIKRQIFGKWRNVNSVTNYFSAKIEGDAFMDKWSGKNSFSKHMLEVKYQNGWTTSVINNKIVQRQSSDNGEETWRREFHFDNEKIIVLEAITGKADQKFTFERIGDPDEK